MYLIDINSPRYNDFLSVSKSSGKIQGKQKKELNGSGAFYLA
jgi:hypothetical protein